MEPVNHQYNSRDHDQSANNDRARRKVKFDWQKDEDYSDDEERGMEAARSGEDDYGSSVLWSGKVNPGMIAVHQSKQLEIDFDHTTTTAVPTTTTTQKIGTIRPTKSDIKAILWDQGVEANIDSHDQKITTNTSQKERNAVSSTSAAPTTNSEPSTIAQTKLLKSESELMDVTTTEAITQSSKPAKAINKATLEERHHQSVKAKVSAASANHNENETLGTGRTLHTEMPLSVNEDMIRTYTLASNETYGFGKAKPKIITKKLAEMQMTEYSEEAIAIDATESAVEDTEEVTTNK